MTFLSQIILMGEQGDWHQAHRLVEMRDVEKGKDLSTAKGKGKDKKKDKKNVCFSLGCTGLHCPVPPLWPPARQGRGQHLPGPQGAIVN